MKMSLCNTFRFFAVFTTIALSIRGSPIPGIVNRQEIPAKREINQDLEPQGSITVELKSDIKGPSYINSLKSNNAKDGTNSIIMDAEGTKKIMNKNSYKNITSTEKATQDNDVQDVENLTQIPLQQVTETILSTTTSGVSLNSQPVNSTKTARSIDENTHPVDISNSTKQVFISQGTVDENRTDISNISDTTLDLEPSTQVTLLEIKDVTEMNTKTDTETFLNTEIMPEKLIKNTKSSSLTSGVTKPSWKKYTIIERKRVPTTTGEPTTLNETADTENIASSVYEDYTTVTEKSEVMVKSESAQGRISLQDAITSDIPSLEKLKTDLLSKFTTKGDIESTTRLLLTEESVTKTDMTTFATTTDSSFNSESPNAIASKRAGYLDLSPKNATSQNDISFKQNGTELLRGLFETGIQNTQDEIPAEKIDKIESQNQLTEDAIKEELLKEGMLSDNEEISKRHREEGKQIETNTTSLQGIETANVTQFDEKLIQPSHTAPDENLSVRPISSDKAKNTVLYPVNPNYKPLKKIEVQPAKPFVRDPDDNSWRNESLSSLGIVFKPKNSSKPFTQVLKNKTETEWNNNLPEKDTKSDVPDLRVRLEQIAQKRKSKKKKIDSFGNVFYTDYEESSSSEENTSTTQVEDPSLGTVSTTDVSASAITIVTPLQTTSISTPTAPILKEVSALTTTSAPIEKSKSTPKKDSMKVTTLKPPKMFNLFDYYEANDDEDIADYLNMAKIDLKKYTVPIHTTYTPYTSPPLPLLYTNAMTQYTQERKGTVQYFPPRTTKRPKNNKHINVHQKINTLTLTESPKHVIPISYHKLTTPYDNNMYYTNGPDMSRFKDDLVPKNFDGNLYLTTSPHTTMPDPDEHFGAVGGEGGYNKPNYVIKSYKDYTNREEHEEERGKNQKYAFAEPPAHDVTLADYIKPTTVKYKTTVTDDYDYEAEFRKDLLDRFVANFNEKSNRFKSDFPVVYNNSIVHGASYDEKDVAMSRAYFRRPYSNQDYRPVAREPYDPNCDNVTVELSPAYELHYYVPEQEEKQEVEAKPINLLGRYRL